MGVASNRVDVHQVCAAAERALERRAEPLSALLLTPDQYPTRLLDLGWRNLVLNSAHDSSCACSADEVVDAVVVRYQEARQIGDALARDALTDLATRDRRRARVDARRGTRRAPIATGLVAAHGPGRRAGAPRRRRRHARARRRCSAIVGGDGFSATVVGTKVRWVLEMIRGPEFAGAAHRSRHPQRARAERLGVHAARGPRRRRADRPRGPARRAARARRAGRDPAVPPDAPAGPRRARAGARRPRVRVAHVHRGRGRRTELGAARRRRARWRTSTCASRSTPTTARSRSPPATASS